MGSALFRDLALIDNEPKNLRPGMSILVQDRTTRWIRPLHSEEDPSPDWVLVDAGLVDAHRHLTLPGGSHWVERASGSTAERLAAAERDAKLLHQAWVGMLRVARLPGILLPPARARGLVGSGAFRPLEWH